MNKIYDIKILIAENQLNKAISSLLSNDEIINNNEYFNELVIMNLSYKQIQEMDTKSLLKKEECNRQVVLLARNILLFLDEIENRNRSG